MVLTRDLGTLAKRSTWRARVLREIIITTETHHCETLAMLLLADAEAAAGNSKAVLSRYQSAAVDSGAATDCDGRYLTSRSTDPSMDDIDLCFAVVKAALYGRERAR